MTPYEECLNRWFKGHPSACQFIEMVFAALHLWDDLTDKDKSMRTDKLHQVMSSLFIDLPRNPFYIANFAQLNSVLHLAIVNWHIANLMEESHDANDKAIAFILRSTYVDLVTTCALILYGPEWAIAVGMEARQRTASEGMTAYLTALAGERRSAFIQEVSNGLD